MTDKENDTVPLYVTLISNVGRELDSKNAVITSEALTPQFAMLDDAGNVIPVAAGNAEFKVSVTLGGNTIVENVIIPVSPGKRKATYFTEKEAQNARQNISKYSFAKEEAASAPAKAVSTPSASIANKQEIIAASCAVIAEELGTDVRNIKVTSFKKL